MMTVIRTMKKSILEGMMLITRMLVVMITMRMAMMVVLTMIYVL